MDFYLELHVFRAVPVRKKDKIVKIQLWNLGFVEAYQNSILRGQGLST